MSSSIACVASEGLSRGEVARLSRRNVLGLTAAALLSPRLAWAEQLPKDVRITRIVSFDLLTRRPHHVGQNSYAKNHGVDASERMIRLYTDAGIEGIGTSWDTRESCQQVLGRKLSEIYQTDERRMIGPFKRYTTPYWDLAGRLLGKPVYELLGAKGPERVPAYDGAIYFVDLIPQHEKDWEAEFRRRLDLSLSNGHRAFKIKIGRGSKLMPTAEGDARDVVVLRLIRRHLGPDIHLYIDANDGYDLPRVKHLMEQIADLKIEFIEEMIPVTTEKFDEYLDLRAFLKDRGIQTLIADGENLRRPDEMRKWVETRAVDILQGDMNLFGFEDILAEAQLGATNGLKIAPHNWGSLIGYYLQLQVGRSIPNFVRAEQDPMSSPVIVADGYQLKEGTSSLPKAPGLGLTLNEKAFADGVKVQFDIKA